MPTETVSARLDSIESEIHIPAPPERVFQALIDPQQVMSWWTEEACPIEHFSLDPRIGGKWTYDTGMTKMNVNGVSKFHCEGEVLEFEPARILAYTWIANWHDDKTRRTVVRWELTAEGSGTRLKVTHSGLAEEVTARKDYAGGWPGVLDQVKRFIEK